METQLPPLTLPSGATVEFVDVDDLTGGDIQALRRVVSQTDSVGEAGNKLVAKGLELLIKTWSVAYLPDPSTPRGNPSALRKLKARDYLELERHATDMIMFLSKGAPPESIDDTSPGSPTPPESE